MSSEAHVCWNMELVASWPRELQNPNAVKHRSQDLPMLARPVNAGLRGVAAAGVELGLHGPRPRLAMLSKLEELAQDQAAEHLLSPCTCCNS